MKAFFPAILSMAFSPELISNKFLEGRFPAVTLHSDGPPLGVGGGPWPLATGSRAKNVVFARRASASALKPVAGAPSPFGRPLLNGSVSAVNRIAIATPLLLAALLMILVTSTPAVGQETGRGAEAESEALTSTDLPSAASDLLSAAVSGEGEGQSAPAPSLSEVLGTDGPPPMGPSYGLDILQAFGMFILVLALLFITLKVLGRFGRFRGRKSQESIFNMRGVMPLDNRKYLAAVEVEGRLLVVGVTQDRIIPLADWVRDKKAGEPHDEFSFQLAEEDDLPPDISIADTRGGGSK
ncbi:hypothetical protein C4J81_12570 [Deltaproteobacteria bacterium Smac51]|nr:hypothetical protein C4J81_12570 [Deltaproteobacteria bacterium Smac51]